MYFLPSPRSAAGRPLHSLFPLASFSLSLRRVRLPKPTSPRFYSSYLLSTPASRRPIHRHGLLSRAYVTNQGSHGKPTVEEVEEWDADGLLEWIQQQQPNPLRNDRLEMFKKAKTTGPAFLNSEFLQDEFHILPNTAVELARLVKKIKGERTPDRKRKVEDAFKTGIKYRPPHPLVDPSGMDWPFQPHPELYKTLASSVLSHYHWYKKNNIDKTYMPAYYYVGAAGTGKSRHGTEFASSVQEAVARHPQQPLSHELAQRLKKAFVFHVSFEKGACLENEMKNPWNAIGTRMLAQLLDQPFDVVNSRYAACPQAIFRLVAKAENVDLYNDFTGILVVDGLQEALARHGDDKDKDRRFYRLLAQISALSLMSRNLPETENGTLRRAPFIMTSVTATYFRLLDAYWTDTHRRRVYLPLNPVGTADLEEG